MAVTTDGPPIEEILNRLQERVRARKTKPSSYFKVLTARHGDRKVQWDKGKKEDVEDARATFDYYTKELSYKAFVLVPGPNGGPDQKGAEIKAFDPDVEGVIFVPQMQGG